MYLNSVRVEFRKRRIVKGYVESVCGVVFFGDDVFLVVGIGRDLDAFSLAKGVAVEALVGAYGFALVVDDGSGIIRNIVF